MIIKFVKYVLLSLPVLFFISLCYGPGEKVLKEKRDQALKEKLIERGVLDAFGNIVTDVSSVPAIKHKSAVEEAMERLEQQKRAKLNQLDPLVKKWVEEGTMSPEAAIAIDEEQKRQDRRVALAKPLKDFPAKLQGTWELQSENPDDFGKNEFLYSSLRLYSVSVRIKDNGEVSVICNQNGLGKTPWGFSGYISLVLDCSPYDAESNSFSFRVINRTQSSSIDPKGSIVFEPDKNSIFLKIVGKDFYINTHLPRSEKPAVENTLSRPSDEYIKEKRRENQRRRLEEEHPNVFKSLYGKDGKSSFKLPSK